MPRYAIYDGTATVVRIITCADRSTAMMNAPTGCAAETCADSVQPGWKRAAGKFVAPTAAPLTLDQMLEIIDAEREGLSRSYMTPGRAITYEYGEKAREYREWSGLTLALQLNTANRFPWTAAEMKETGDTIQVVMARIGEGIANSAKMQAIAARAQNLKRSLRAATEANRLTLFAARKWPT